MSTGSASIEMRAEINNMTILERSQKMDVSFGIATRETVLRKIHFHSRLETGLHLHMVSGSEHFMHTVLDE